MITHTHDDSFDTAEIFLSVIQEPNRSQKNMWIQTEYIGIEGDEELYVLIPRHTLKTEEEAKAWNLSARKSGSNLRYYHARRLPSSESLPPGRILTEREALYYRDEPVENWPPPEFIAWLYGEDEETRQDQALIDTKGRFKF